MVTLQEVAYQYDLHAAQLITRRADKEGKLSPKHQRAVEYYRGAGDAIRALINQAEMPEGSEWNMQPRGTFALAVKLSKVTAADKAATPQELLGKALS